MQKARSTETARKVINDPQGQQQWHECLPKILRGEPCSITTSDGKTYRVITSFESMGAPVEPKTPVEPKAELVREGNLPERITGRRLLYYFSVAVGAILEPITTVLFTCLIIIASPLILLGFCVHKYRKRRDGPK